MWQTVPSLFIDSNAFPDFVVVVVLFFVLFFRGRGGERDAIVCSRARQSYGKNFYEQSSYVVV